MRNTEPSNEDVEAAVRDVMNALDVPISLERPIPARCGVTAKIEVDGRAALLKHVTTDESDPFTLDRAAGIRNEAGILADLGRTVTISPVGRDITTWMIQPWLHGESSWRRTAFIRAGGSSDRHEIDFLAEVSRLAAALEDLHHSGIYHGDVQPGHFILTDTDVHLVDFDVSVRVNETGPQYRGALVHYVAPEVAAGMLGGDTSIRIDASTEVFAFGAVLFHLYTGRVPHWYGSDPLTDDLASTGRDEKCRAIVDRRRRGVDQFDVPAIEGLAEIIDTCMAEPRERFAGMAEVSEALRTLLRQRRRLMS